jgi:orotidine-5'-phosphate decarboxylase
VSQAPIAVALDAPELTTLAAWAAAVGPHVSTLKVGLETYLRDGRAAVETARTAAPECALFLDLKLHDIPATVSGAARAVADLAPDYLTVHASGGPAMVSAAAEALPDTRIVAVTVLTSLTTPDLLSMGMLGSGGAGTAGELAVRLAVSAVDAGARAIVCSPEEVGDVRTALGDRDVVLITPGVRPAGAQAGDQRRIATPREAMARGADLLVIGRPITGAPDVGAAAEAIARELDHG